METLASRPRSSIHSVIPGGLVSSAVNWGPSLAAAAAVPRLFRAQSHPSEIFPALAPTSPSSSASTSPSTSTSSSRKSSDSGPSPVVARARTASISHDAAATSAPASKKRKASVAGLGVPSIRAVSVDTGDRDSPVPADSQYSHLAADMSDVSPTFSTISSTTGPVDSPALASQPSRPPPLTPGFTYAFENETAAAAAAEDDGSEEGEEGKKVVRRKIRIEYIPDKSRRHITFSKRKAGIMKKAYELATLTGTQVLLLVVSETGLVYTFTTTKLQPLVLESEGKNLIQACLNTRDGESPTFNAADAEEPESNPNFQPSVPVQGGQVALKAKLPGIRDRRSSSHINNSRMMRRASMPQPRVTPIPPPAPPAVPSLPSAHAPSYNRPQRLQPHHPFAEPGGLHIAGLEPHHSPMVEPTMSYETVAPNPASMHQSMMSHNGYPFAPESHVAYTHAPPEIHDSHHGFDMHGVPIPHQLPMYLPAHPLTPGGHDHPHLHHMTSPGAPSSPHDVLAVGYGDLTVSPRDMSDSYEYDQLQPSPPGLGDGSPGHHSTPHLSTGIGQEDYFGQDDETD